MSNTKPVEGEQGEGGEGGKFINANIIITSKPSSTNSSPPSSLQPWRLTITAICPGYLLREASCHCCPGPSVLKGFIWS